MLLQLRETDLRSDLKKIKIRVNKFLSLTVSEIVVTLTISDVKSNLVSR